MKITKSFNLSLLLLCAVCFLSACSGPAAPAQPGPMSPQSFLMATIWFILVLFLVYFTIVIQPAQARNDRQKKFLEGLKKNDEVVTSGGIFARVVAVKPEYITLEIASNVKIKVEPDKVSPVPKVESSGGTEQEKGQPAKK